MDRTLGDGDVERLLSQEDIVAVMELALREHAAGDLEAPPRFSVEGDGGSLVFTAGAATGHRRAMGFRVYETFPGGGDDRTQIVAVFDAGDGTFRGVVLGYEVGIRRTAGIDGVAIEHLARDDVARLGVLGTGTQARAHTRTACAVRSFDEVQAYSPTPEHRRTFAETVGQEVGPPVDAVDDPQEAVEDADVVVCATRSEKPVFDAEWLADGTHVTTIGPKFEGSHELPLPVADRARTIVTDSLAQVEGYADYDRPFFLPDDHRERMAELGDVVVGDVPGRTGREDVTLFCSVGLAGTEVLLADEVLRQEFEVDT